MDVAYTVERTIEDVEFSESYVENRREEVRVQLAKNGATNPSDERIERLVREELQEVADSMTLEAQGHNDLHRDISIGEADRKL